jgi:hypothetical protein
MTKTIADIQGSGAGKGYYDRILYPDPAFPIPDFDQHLFLAGNILQSAEMNEIQTTQHAHLKGVADALFKDGDIVRDCRAVIQNLIATIESGAIYIEGQVRGVPQGNVTVTATGTTILGIWLVPQVITPDDAPGILDPGVGHRAFKEPGAYRLRYDAQWGKATDQIADATFYPVYYVDDGQLRAKEPPPNLDAVTQALARYDVDSNGSNYIIEGLRMSRLDDDATNQYYSVEAGRARVNGFGIAQNSSRRVPFPIDIPTQQVDQESFRTTTVNGKATVTLRYTPLDKVTSLRVLQLATLTVTRLGGVNTDKFKSTEYPQKIITISAGGKPYVEGTDYTFDPNGGGLITWLTTGTSPSAGSTYDVKCNHWVYVQPENPTINGFEVSDVVNGDNDNPTTVYVSYLFRLPRIDRLIVDEDGKFSWIKGIASEINPVAPPVPNNVLSIAQVYQAWRDNTTDTYITNDGVRMVTMSTLESMNARLDTVTDMIAQLNLISDINVRDAGAKKGLFVDPFVNNDQRDQGHGGELAIAGNCLQLPITAKVLVPVPPTGSTPITEIVSCDYVEEIILSNTARTSSMRVNPYDAFDPPFPGGVTISPQVDRWVDTKTTWAAPETRYFVTTVYAPWTSQWGMHMTQNYTTGQIQTNELASSSTADAEYLRQIDVSFNLSGFLPNEEILATFDGLPVTLN